MTLSKTTFDKSVKYNSQSERGIQPNTIRNNSFPKKQNKNTSQNSEKLIKNISEGFGILKGIMIC